VRSTFKVPNSRFPVPNTQFKVRHTRFNIPNTQFTILPLKKVMKKNKDHNIKPKLHIVSDVDGNVQQISPALSKLQDQFAQVESDAAALVIIAVRNDGTPIWLLPSNIPDLPALIMAVDETLADLKCQYSAGLNDAAD